MAYVNSRGYLCRTTNGRLSQYDKVDDLREWWLIKHSASGKKVTSLTLSYVNFPKRYAGKKIRFKVEIIEPDRIMGKKR